MCTTGTSALRRRATFLRPLFPAVTIGQTDRSYLLASRRPLIPPRDILPSDSLRSFVRLPLPALPLSFLSVFSRLSEGLSVSVVTGRARLDRKRFIILVIPSIDASYTGIVVSH